MSVVEHVVAGNDRQTEKFSCCFDQLGDVVMLSRCHVNAIHLQNAEHPSERRDAKETQAQLLQRDRATRCTS